MNYSKHNAYKILTKKEKQFLNVWIGKLKEEFRSRELEQEFFVNIDQTKFVHKDNIIQLFFQSDEFGSVPDKLGDHVPRVAELENLARKTIGNDVKKTLMGINKDVYGRGAYKRWKKHGLIIPASSESQKEIVTLNGQRYEIVVEGKKFRLVVPGQKQLPLSEGEQTNAKVEESKVNKVRSKRSK